mgnify:FL=1
MDTNLKREYIIRKLNEFKQDPELRALGPLFDEMLSNIDIPEFDVQEFDRIFTQCLYNNTVNSLAKGAYINSAMHTRHKKWYEYED